MSILNVWDCDNVYSQDDILFVREDDVAFFVELQRAGDIPAPKKCYRIPQSADLKQISVFMHYVSLCHPELTINIDAAHSSQCKFFISWVKLVESLNRLDYSSSCLFLEEVRSSDVAFFQNYKYLLDIIGEYIEVVIRPLVCSSPYCNVSFFDKIDLWYKAPVTHTALLNKYKDRIGRSFFYPEPTLSALREYVAKLIRIWEKFQKGKASDQMFSMSAYFYFLSRRFIFQKNYGLVVLLVHRTMELFLNQLCVQAGLIQESGCKLVYSSSDKDSAPLSLMNSEHELIVNDILVKDQKRFDFLNWLNKSRNFLLYTHNVYCASEQDATTCINRCRTLIRDIEGTIRWEQMADSFGPFDIFKITTLFETEPSIDTFCYELSY